jgi:hypothetical protein
MRWTKSRDGKRRVTVRAEYRLDRENLADILCHRALSMGWDLSESRSVAFLESEVREELSGYGMSTWPYWRENDYDGQAAELESWARKQVDRL